MLDKNDNANPGQRGVSKPAHSTEQAGLYQLALANSPIGVALLHPSGRWLNVNASLCRMLGYPRDVLLEMDPITLIHPDDVHVDRVLQKKLTACEITFYETEKRFLSKTGDVIFVFLTVSTVFDSAGKVLCHMMQFQDKTSEFNERLQADLASRDSREFIARITHDLRMPLSSMPFSIERVLQHLKSEDIKSASQYAEYLNESIGKLEKLALNILQAGKLEQQAVSVQKLNIAELIQVSLNKLSSMQHFKRLRIDKVYAHENAPISLVNHMAQVIDNLLSNAIRFQDLSKPESFIQIRTYEQGDIFGLDVLDNGLGVPKNSRSSLFNMFTRIHDSASTGSGLGLYLANKSARAMQGNILYEPLSIESGSLFRLTVPKFFDVNLDTTAT